MSYYFSKVVDGPFDETVAKVTLELKEGGFGILTETDVKETLMKILNVDFRRYKILGACTPPFAHKAFAASNKIGAMLSCDVVVQEISDAQVRVSAIDPLASLQAVENPKLKKYAAEIGTRLKTVIDRI